VQVKLIVLIIAGFLGSGKTTFILSLAQQFINAGKKVAIVENEVGEIGIDGELVRRAGLTVRELFNGCICCQLRADLVPTLETLAEKIRPDYLLIEPSGIAEPQRILGTLSYYRGPAFQGIQTMTLVDPTRIPELFEILAPLIKTQIKAANTVIINKIDIATKGEIIATREIIRELNPDALIEELCAHEGADQKILDPEEML
jgi:G3E family GTPase